MYDLFCDFKHIYRSSYIVTMIISYIRPIVFNSRFPHKHEPRRLSAWAVYADAEPAEHVGQGRLADLHWGPQFLHEEERPRWSTDDGAARPQPHGDSDAHEAPAGWTVRTRRRPSHTLHARASPAS